MTIMLNVVGEITAGLTSKCKWFIVISGSWGLQGNDVRLNMDMKSPQIRLDKIEIEGTDEATQKAFMKQIKEHETEFVKQFASDGLDAINLESFSIENVTKTEMTTKMDDDTIIFKRIK